MHEPSPGPTTVRIRSGERGARLLAGTAITLGLALFAWLLLAGDRATTTTLDWASVAPPADQPMRPWRYVVLHHSGQASGDTASIDRNHLLERGWEGIGYHFVIGNGQPMALGRIDATWRWRTQVGGAHAGTGAKAQPFDEAGIGICLIGDYRQVGPDPAVEARLADLCALLVTQIPTLSVNRIIAHREVPGKQTDCPGRVDLQRLRYLVRERLGPASTER